MMSGLSQAADRFDPAKGLLDALASRDPAKGSRSVASARAAVRVPQAAKPPHRRARLRKLVVRCSYGGTSAARSCVTAFPRPLNCACAIEDRHAHR
jgi:hypothetical protein